MERRRKPCCFHRSGFTSKWSVSITDAHTTIGRVTVPPSTISLRPSFGGKALSGFLLSGFLMALLGAILPAWGYHRDPPAFTAVGNYFLSLALGLVVSPLIARRLLARRGLSFLLVAACIVSCVALAYLAA